MCGGWGVLQCDTIDLTIMRRDNSIETLQLLHAAVVCLCKALSALVLSQAANEHSHYTWLSPATINSESSD